jgi:AsmA protein
MKILKYALITLGILILLFGGVLAYIAATFDPNEYKPQIVQAVKEHTQRELKLEGDIKLALFPSIGARVGKAALSERGGKGQFAAVTDLKVVVKLAPLLSRQVVVDAIEVKGLRANLVRFKDGKTNFDDLAGAGAKPAPKSGAPGAPLKIDIDHVLIEDSAFTFADQAAGARYELSKVNLKTGRIASGVPTRIDLAATLRSDKPKLDVEATVKARAVIDLEKQRYTLEGLDVAAKGAAAGMTSLALSAKGDVALRPAAQELSASKLAVALSGKPAAGEFNVKFEIPRLNVSKESVSGERIALEATMNETKRKLVAKIELSALTGNAAAFKAAALAADVELRQEGAAVKAKFVSPAAGSLDQQRFALSKLAANFTVNHAQLPKNPLEATLDGALEVDWGKQTASSTFAATIDESTIKGKAGVARFDPPYYTFDLDVDRLDADRYLPKTDAKAKQPEQPLDLSALKALNASGSVRIGSLKVSNVKASNVKLDIKAANGKLGVSPMSANLYQGSLAGALAVNAQASPVFAVRQKLTGVSVGPLLKDIADNDSLEGRGTVALDVTARGNTVSALKKALNGSAAVSLADGAVKGINVAQSIRGAKAKLGTLRGEQVQESDKAQKTDFSELTATFNIKDGVARNDDLSMKSPLLRVGGAGNIDLGNDKLDYLVQATIVGTIKGQGGRGADDLAGLTVPVRVSGPVAAPGYRLDFSAVVTETVKQKVEQTVRSKIEERLGGAAQEAPKGETRSGPAGGALDALKGLFGR